MKNILTLTTVLVSAAFNSMAQTTDEEMDVKVTHQQCTKFIKTPPLRDMMKTMTPVDDEHYYDNWVPKDKRKKPSTIEIVDRGIPETDNIDPVLQSVNGSRSGEGWTRANWQAQSGAFPPDPSGAAGPDHYVQAVNSTYRVYNKDGSTASSIYPLASLWPGSTSDGDPIVMYDRFADRWFISQFQTTASEILIAVSETSDPLGQYFVYTFPFTYTSMADDFPDFPKFGVWSNAYLMSANTSNKDCVGYERDKMLLGDPTASSIVLSFPYINQYFNSIAPAYAEGPTLPESDEPGYFFALQDDSWGVPDDCIKIFRANFNWTTPSSSSVVIHQTLYPSNFNTVFSPGYDWADLTQQGSTQKLDAVVGMFGYKAQYRRFPDYNVVMLCNTVDVSGTDRAGIRWYELRDSNTGTWSIYQEGTYAPDATNSRWLGNLAMDAQGNIAMAYSFVGPSDYPGIRYTGRYKNDPLGQMTVQEQIAVEGTGAQTLANRYGDYSQMTMDPTNDMTFWFTGEYIGPAGARRTRIISFSSWHLLGEDEQVAPTPFFNAYQPNPETVRVIWHDLADTKITATMTDIQGKLISAVQIDTENAQEDFNVSSLATGIYFVTLTGQNTNLSKKIYIAK